MMFIVNLYASSADSTILGSMIAAVKDQDQSKITVLLP